MKKLKIFICFLIPTIVWILFFLFYFFYEKEVDNFYYSWALIAWLVVSFYCLVSSFISFLLYLIIKKWFLLKISFIYFLILCIIMPKFTYISSSIIYFTLDIRYFLLLCSIPVIGVIILRKKYKISWKIIFKLYIYKLYNLNN